MAEPYGRASTIVLQVLRITDIRDGFPKLTLTYNARNRFQERAMLWCRYTGSVGYKGLSLASLARADLEVFKHESNSACRGTIFGIGKGVLVTHIFHVDAERLG